MKTGNTVSWDEPYQAWRVPQWSPVMKTGNTSRTPGITVTRRSPQWSPVMKTGNTALTALGDKPGPRLNGARS